MSNQQIAKQDPRDIRAYLNSDRVKLEIARVLPKHITADRLTRVALTAFLKTPALLNCTQESLFDSILRCAQAGLEPDGRLAHLIPYGKVCQVIFDYKGLVALGLRNGMESIYGDKVCENDAFDARVVDGVKKINHAIDWKKPRGKEYAYYAVAVRGGVVDYEIMTVDEISAVRNRSRAANGGPWVTDFDEMAKKTVLRRMSKRWDLMPEIRDVINSDDDTPDFEGPKVTTSRPIFKEPEKQAKVEPAPAPKEAPTEAEAPQPDAPEEEGGYDPTAKLRGQLKQVGIGEKVFLHHLFDIGLTDVEYDDANALAVSEPEALTKAENRFDLIVAHIKKEAK